jgi:hypothetical protein
VLDAIAIHAARLVADAGVNPLNWLQTGTLGSTLAFIIWAFFVKDPPLWVSWREHATMRTEKDHRIAELIGENRELRGLGQASANTAHKAVDVAAKLQAVVDELRGPAR